MVFILFIMNETFRPDINKFFVLDKTQHIVRAFSTYAQASNFRNMNNPSWVVSRNPFNRW